MKQVYISGPISNGGKLQLHDELENVRYATELAAEFIHKGINPVCPHWSLLAERFVHMRISYEDWLKIDMDTIERCDAVYRISGDSGGADREVAHAVSIGKPVFYNLLALYEWAGVEMGNKFQER